jgi:predicted membrane channel-forming protein YqfA (hemolysin III family)
MSHDLLVFIMVWRLAWYGYLVYHSVKVKAWRDCSSAFLLMVLSAVVNPNTKPYLALAAFLVAPLLTIGLVRYQKRR